MTRKGESFFMRLEYIGPCNPEISCGRTLWKNPETLLIDKNPSVGRNFSILLLEKKALKNISVLYQCYMFTIVIRTWSVSKFPSFHKYHGYYSIFVLYYLIFYFRFSIFVWQEVTFVSLSLFVFFSFYW